MEREISLGCRKFLADSHLLSFKFRSVFQPQSVIQAFAALVAFSALTLLAGRQEGHPARKKNMGGCGGGHWLVRSLNGVAPSQSVCLPLLIFPCTIKSRSSLLALAHPLVPKKGRTTVVVVVVVAELVISFSG